MSYLVPTNLLPLAVQHALKDNGRTTMPLEFWDKVRAATPYKSADKSVPKSPGIFDPNPSAQVLQSNVTDLHFDMFEFFILHLFRSPILPWIANKCNEKESEKIFGRTRASSNSVSEKWNILPNYSTSASGLSEPLNMGFKCFNKSAATCQYINPVYYKCVQEMISQFLDYSSGRTSIGSKPFDSSSNPIEIPEIASSPLFTRGAKGFMDISHNFSRKNPEKAQSEAKIIPQPLQPTPGTYSITAGNTREQNKLKGVCAFTLSSMLYYWLPDDPPEYQQCDPHLGSFSYYTELHLSCVKFLISQLNFSEFEGSFHSDLDTKHDLINNGVPLDYKRAFCARFQDRIFVFFKRAIDCWPNEDTFHLLVQAWSSYVRPWDANSLSEAGYSDKWTSYVKKNYAFYTEIFVLLLRRLRSFDMCASLLLDNPETSTKHLNTLEQILDVYKNENLLHALKLVERISLSNERISKGGYSPRNQQVLPTLKNPCDNSGENAGIFKSSKYLRTLDETSVNEHREQLSPEVFVDVLTKELEFFMNVINKKLQKEEMPKASFENVLKCFRILKFYKLKNLNKNDTNMASFLAYPRNALVLTILFGVAFTIWSCKFALNASSTIGAKLGLSINGNNSYKANILLIKSQRLSECIKIIKLIHANHFNDPNINQKREKRPINDYKQPLARNQKDVARYEKQSFAFPKSNNLIESLGVPCSKKNKVHCCTNISHAGYLPKVVLGIATYLNKTYMNIRTMDSSIPVIPSFDWLMYFSSFKDILFILAAIFVLRLLVKIPKFIYNTLLFENQGGNMHSYSNNYDSRLDPR